MNIDDVEKKQVVYWCRHCKTPIIRAKEKGIKSCHLCGNKLKFLCADIRPVFPEERLLIEILSDQPLAFIGQSVWASKTRWYIDGKVLSIPAEIFDINNAALIKQRFNQFSYQNVDTQFQRHIDTFVIANSSRFEEIKNEAKRFICYTSETYEEFYRYISFSAGKDSTVTSHLVLQALKDNNIKHIFGDTTLEFPPTYEYVKRFKLCYNVETARNDDRDFYDMCDIIGSPSRNMRWCCTMFKTGPISRINSADSESDHILTFLGIRAAESPSRKNYGRVNYGDSSAKIQGQIAAYPIYHWIDVEVWLYILSEKIDFNETYRLGYHRVGCYCCPNNSPRNEFITAVFFTELSQKWRDKVYTFACNAGKETPFDYMNKGYWKARIGGRGLSSSKILKIRKETCAMEENAQVYKLARPMDNSFWNLFIPLGIVSRSEGRKLLSEVIILDYKSKIPLLSITPHATDLCSVKIKTFDGTNSKELQRKCGYQVRKYNICQSCLKCEAICDNKAISIGKSGYCIDDGMCKRCGKCVSNKYLAGGCLMYRFLFDSEHMSTSSSEKQKEGEKLASK